MKDKGGGGVSFLSPTVFISEHKNKPFINNNLIDNT